MASSLWVCLTCGEHLQDTQSAISKELGQHVCRYKVLKKTNLEAVQALIRREIEKPPVSTAAAPPPPELTLAPPKPIILNPDQGSMKDRISACKLKKANPSKEKKGLKSRDNEGGLYNELKRVLKMRNEKISKEKEGLKSHDNEGGPYNELKRALKKRDEQNDQCAENLETIDSKRFKEK